MFSSNKGKLEASGEMFVVFTTSGEMFVVFTTSGEMFVVFTTSSAYIPGTLQDCPRRWMGGGGGLELGGGVGKRIS